MIEFLDLLETMRADEATVARLFSDAGVGVRTTPKGLSYQARLVEAAKLVADVMKGRKPAYYLREAMTTSDFPLLFGDILDRQLLANYTEWPSTWQTYCARKTVPDFRLVNRFSVTGAETILTAVPELTAYPEVAMAEARFQYHVNKYGRRIPFSWEAIINDDLDALKDIPQRFGRAARRSEDRFATVLHVDANGPDVTFYSNAHLNKITVACGNLVNNPVLGIPGLQAGMHQLALQVDAGGDPIVVDAVVLEVPPALEITARNILNATQLWIEQALAAPQTMLLVENWMKNRVSLVVNPYIPLVAPVAAGNTSWFLHASPTNGRPAFEMGFLRGHEQPEVFMKAPNAVRVGGGAANPMDGDFDTDSVEYKVRHVFGGVTEEIRASVASFGTAAP